MPVSVIDVGETVAAAKRLCGELTLVEAIAASPERTTLVLRCQTRASGSVILKRGAPGHAAMRNELSALDFLGAASDAAGLIPEVLGIEPSWNLIVLEDLGSNRSCQLGRLLVKGGGALALETLRQMQRAQARLHALARRDLERYRALRAKYGADENARTSHGVYVLAREVALLEERARGLGVSAPPALERAVEGVLTVLQSPDLETLVHGDLTPANTMVRKAGCCFIDWETSDVRHAFVDGSFGPLRYLHSSWAMQLPLKLGLTLWQDYVDELTTRWPARLDPGELVDSLLAVSAAWALALCRWISDCDARDLTWGTSTKRQRIVAALRRYQELCSHFGKRDALTEIFGAMEGNLRVRWADGELELPVYPSLAGLEAGEA